LLKIQTMNFYIYQNGNLIYGYKGLIEESVLLVHFVILGGSSVGAFKTLKFKKF
jgi:hypothetical protein